MPFLSTRHTALPALVLLLAAAPLAAQMHEDPKLGYKIRVPKEWQQVPLQTNEGWIVAKYLSKETHFYTDPGLGRTFEHKPTFQVVAFVARPEEKGEEGGEEGQGGAEVETGDGELTIRFGNPFKDYESYLKGTYSGGGFYVAEEKEGKVGDVAATQYQIKVEKGSSEGPKLLITWVYHVEGADLAAQFEVLENAYPKLKGEIERCLKSFKTMPRTEGGVEEAASRSEGQVKFKVGEGELTLEERTKRRKEQEKEAHAKASQGLPSDWEVSRMGRFLVLNHSDEKHAKRVVEHGEAVLRWLDDNLDYVGTGEYVRAPIIRICRDWEEEREFRTGTSWWGMPGLEVTTHKSDMGATSYEYEYLNQRLLSIWLAERDPQLSMAMPGWFRFGLGHVVGTASCKDGKLEFKPDMRELNNLREALRAGTTAAAQDVFMFDSDSLQNQNNLAQAAALVRFLVVGSGVRNKTARGVVPAYLIHVREVAAEILEEEQKAREAAEEKKPESEEEEEERYKQEQQRWKEREERVLEETFKRTFGAWTEKEWDALEAGYRKDIG